MNITLPPYLNPKNLYPLPILPSQAPPPSPWFLPVTQVAFMSTTFLNRTQRIRYAAPLLLVLVSRTRSYNTGDLRDFLRMAWVFGVGCKFVDFGVLVKEGCVFKLKEEEGRKEGEGGKEGHGEGKKGFWRGVRDSCELYLFTSRGIGWNWEVGGIPKCPEQSKGIFLFRTALRILGTYLAWDFCRTSLGLFPYITTVPRGLFFSLPIWQQVLLTWLHQLEAFCFINTPYQLSAFFTVLISYLKPEDWPPLFGSLSDGYLVSKAWGRVWHQLLRRQFGVFTTYVQDFVARLGGKGRSWRRVISLACSFGMSGLYHWSGVVNMPWTGRSAGMLWYFFLQVPAIRVEDLVVEWGERRGIRGNRWLRTLGYLWTVSWISFSMRYAAAWQFETGALSIYEPFFGFSVFGWVVRSLLG